MLMNESVEFALFFVRILPEKKKYVSPPCYKFCDILINSIR